MLLKTMPASDINKDNKIKVAGVLYEVATTPYKADGGIVLQLICPGNPGVNMTVNAPSHVPMSVHIPLV